jgi:REP element-mobilizing transposase RayT
MSRPARLHVPGAMYHVTARGNHRHAIFFKPADRHVLDSIMADALSHTGARVHAYCWMTNHVHMLVQVSEQPLGRLIQRVGTRFARCIQKELHTTGHLFENRYHAVLVDVDSYFLELLRYIHLNPVRARIVEAAHQYRWSSHRVYLGKSQQPWVHTDFGLRMFSTDEQRARELYSAFINQRLGAETSPLTEVHPRERRVLGDDRFLARLSIPVLRRSTATLEQLAAEICDELCVSLEQLRSPHRFRNLCAARARIARAAVSSRVCTLSEVARFLNRSVSALSRAVIRYDK